MDQPDRPSSPYSFHLVVVRGPLIDAESPGGLSPAGARASHASQNGNDEA